MKKHSSSLLLVSAFLFFGACTTTQPEVDLQDPLATPESMLDADAAVAGDAISATEVAATPADEQKATTEDVAKTEEVAKSTDTKLADTKIIEEKVDTDLGTESDLVSEKTEAKSEVVESGSTHTVVAGDWLSKIALSKLGDVNLWKEILGLNPEIKNPDLIFPGNVIKLPAKN